MAETEQSPSHSATTTAGNSSFSIWWPPNERTRGTVRNRLIEYFSTPSHLSNKYGMISPEEAVEAAKRIEEEAYEAAEKATDTNGGIEVLQLYSKVISKRVLETVQSKSVQSSAPEAPPADVTAVGEDAAGSMSPIKSEKMDDD